jgi:putative ABC transport system permease protein
MGIALEKGRIFSGDGQAEVVVSQRLADLVWPGEDPVGRRMRLGSWRSLGDPATEPWRVVVGVVADVAKTLTAENWPDAYIPFDQAVRPDMYLMVRSERDHAALGRELRVLAAELDPTLPLSDIETMTMVIDRELARPRFLALLVAGYALLAVGLALSGLFGTLAFTVAQRRREIAVRLAVGADGRRVVQWLVGQGSWLVIGGIALGVVGSAALNRVLVSQLHGIQPMDLPTFAVLVPALMGAAMLAMWLPARRAAKTEPVEVLRGE